MYIFHDFYFSFIIASFLFRYIFAFFAKNFQLPIEIGQNLYYNKKEADALPPPSGRKAPTAAG
ncbi:MAG: hypothetical protein DBX39_04715 [Bacillota bacterium]|nr:MAG: hypothetical protein DBX39_04715 [Bacillota bacterium]